MASFGAWARKPTVELPKGGAKAPPVVHFFNGGLIALPSSFNGGLIAPPSFFIIGALPLFVFYAVLLGPGSGLASILFAWFN